MRIKERVVIDEATKTLLFFQFIVFVSHLDAIIFSELLRYQNPKNEYDVVERGSIDIVWRSFFQNKKEIVKINTAFLGVNKNSDPKWVRTKEVLVSIRSIDRTISDIEDGLIMSDYFAGWNQTDRSKIVDNLNETNEQTVVALRERAIKIAKDMHKNIAILSDLNHSDIYNRFTYLE